MPEKPARRTPELTRQKLLQAAETLLVREGVHALTVRRIAAEADVNSALIRYHFGGTDGLLRQLVHLNAQCMVDKRDDLLDALDEHGEPDLEASIDALILPLWEKAAMSQDYRAIVVLDEIFSRAAEDAREEVWLLLAKGVERVTEALSRALQRPPADDLRWRIRFVTAAALDIPPRSPRPDVRFGGGAEDPVAAEQRLAQFREFARCALRF